MKTEKSEAAIQMANQIDISVIDHGYVQIDGDWHGDDVRSLYSRLYFVFSGSGAMYYQNQKTVMEPFHIYLIPAGTVFTYHTDTSMEKLFFHINVERTDGYDLLSDYHGIFDLPFDEGTLGSILHLYRQNKVLFALQLKQQIIEILCRFMDVYQFCPEPLPSFSPVIQNTISYIKGNLSIQLNINTLCEQFFISKSMLTKSFRQEVGTSISRYIDNLVFLSAEHQLIYSSLSLKQISDNLGFCDQFYFSRRFHAKYNESPNSYRKRMKNTLQSG